MSINMFCQTAVRKFKMSPGYMCVVYANRGYKTPVMLLLSNANACVVMMRNDNA